MPVTSANNVAKSKTFERNEKKRVLRRAGESPVIHCMLAPTRQHHLLLPTGVMAEVIDYRQPTPMDEAPPWLLGQIEWNKRQVPVFSFSSLINAEDVGDIPPKSKVLIIKSLGNTARVPYLGILLSELPRLLNVKENDLVETGDEKKSLGVYSHIKLGDHAAIVPDLDRLTHLVNHAAFGALPITQLN
jgi:chemosensory pili system protein ChpC